MKVTCTKLVDAWGGEVDHSAWLTVGREYIVLSVYAAVGHPLQFRLRSDDQGNGGSIGLFPSVGFEVVDNTLSTSWTIAVDSKGLLELGPESFQDGDLWVRYYDGEPDAIEAIHNVERGLQ